MTASGTSQSARDPRATRRRWEEQKPLARVAFFGTKGVEEDAVYAMAMDTEGSLSMAIDRGGHLARIIVPAPHLIFLIDLTPMPARFSCDVRVYLDGGFALDTHAQSIRHEVSLHLAMIVRVGEARSRALVSRHAVQEIVPLSDDGDDVSLLTTLGEYDGELWSDLR